jgi:4,5-dihydroxyphthalate decarboxylase
VTEPITVGDGSAPFEASPRVIRSPRNVRLTLAINDSDQVRDVLSGVVQIDGVDLTPLILEAEEIFFRFSRNREWEITELSMGKYTTLRARGDDSVMAIPVFPSRSFRHSAIYVRPDGPRDDPSALAGKRIGIPEWSVTATVYARALLAHEYDVRLEDIEWIQGGTNEPGRVEGIEIDPPAGMTIVAERDRSLSDLLMAGEIEAIIAPHAPDPFVDRSGRIVQLFTDSEAVEADYFRRTGIYPIMHAVVLRGDVYREYPWVAGNLLKAFTAAKERSLVRAFDGNVPRSPAPWGAARARRDEQLFGRDFWPYGIEPNRTTLEAFVTYMHEQGLCDRVLSPEDLFAPETLAAFRV